MRTVLVAYEVRPVLGRPAAWNTLFYTSQVLMGYSDMQVILVRTLLWSEALMLTLRMRSVLTACHVTGPRA